MSKIFKKSPPEDLVIRVFECFGVKGLTDEKEFSRHDIKVDKLDTLLPELEPFYIKYKRFMITRLMNIRYYIQIVRNLCQTRGLIFHSRTTDYGVRYRILNPKNPQSGFIHLLKKEFDFAQIAEKPFIITFSE